MYVRKVGFQNTVIDRHSLLKGRRLVPGNHQHHSALFFSAATMPPGQGYPPYATGMAKQAKKGSGPIEREEEWTREQVRQTHKRRVVVWAMQD